MAADITNYDYSKHKEEVIRLYKDGLKYDLIVKELHLNRMIVSHIIQEYKKETGNFDGKKYIDMEKFKELYMSNEYSIKEIAEQLHVSKATVHNTAKRNNIYNPMRGRGRRIHQCKTDETEIKQRQAKHKIKLFIPNEDDIAILREGEFYCPVCRKVFYISDPGQWVYKLYNNRTHRKYYVCSYKCTREVK